jgi:hypothetical protein
LAIKSKKIPEHEVRGKAHHLCGRKVESSLGSVNLGKADESGKPGRIKPPCATLSFTLSFNSPDAACSTGWQVDAHHKVKEIKGNGSKLDFAGERPSPGAATQIAQQTFEFSTVHRSLCLAAPETGALQLTQSTFRAKTDQKAPKITPEKKAKIFYKNS